MYINVFNMPQDELLPLLLVIDIHELHENVLLVYSIIV